MPDEPKLNVKMPESEVAGRYANLLRITHTREEFVLDFISAVPPQPVVSARVVVSPAHAKRIVQALTQNIARYEGTFGPVAESPGPPEGGLH